MLEIQLMTVPGENGMTAETKALYSNAIVIARSNIHFTSWYDTRRGIGGLGVIFMLWRVTEVAISLLNISEKKHLEELL